MTDTLYIWVDIETSGLDHTDDHLLEIGAIATRDDFQEIGSFHGLTGLPAGWLRDDPESWPIDEVVRDMHTTSGLLDAVAGQDAGAPDEDDLVDAFIDWAVRLHAKSGADRLTLAGSGVATFDVPWLRSRSDPYAYFEWPFSYRVLDISPVRQMLRLAGIDVHLDASSGPTKAHRAMDDVQAHLAEAVMIRDRLARMHAADVTLGRIVDFQDGPDAMPPGGEL